MIVVFALAPPETDVLSGAVAPRIPAGWRREREGITGWWSLYAPGVPSSQTRVVLLETGASIAAGALRLFQAGAETVEALRLLAGILEQVPWWATVAELRAYRATSLVPEGRDATWGTRTAAVLTAWRDMRSTSEAGAIGADAVGAYHTLAGLGHRQLGETTTRQAVLDAIASMASMRGGGS